MIVNYLLGAFAILVGITSILRVFGVMKPSRKFSAMRDKLGAGIGTILYIIFYGILPLAVGGYFIMMGIKGVLIF